MATLPPRRRRSWLTLLVLGAALRASCGAADTGLGVAEAAPKLPEAQAVASITEFNDNRGLPALRFRLLNPSAPFDRLTVRRSRGPVVPGSCDAGELFATFPRAKLRGARLTLPTTAKKPLSNGDSYRVCAYRKDRLVATSTLAGERHVPWLSARALPGAIEVDVRVSPLDDDAVSFALVFAEKGEPLGGLVRMTCRDGRVVREVGRAVFAAAGGDDLTLPFRVAPPEIRRDRRYAVLGCVRDREGRLHAVEEAWGTSVSLVDGPEEHNIVATPSGGVQDDRIAPGHHVLAYDVKKKQQVTTRVRSVRTKSLPSVWLRLDDGRRIEVPQARAFFLPDAGTFRAASKLQKGDVLLTASGARPRLAAAPSDAGQLHAALLDVGAPDDCFIDDLLVRDERPSQARAGEPEKLSPPPAGPIELVPAPSSYDCSLDVRLHVRELPPEARAVAIVAAPQEKAPGARAALTCDAGTVVRTLDRRLLDALLGERALRTADGAELDVQLSGDPIDCDGGHLLVPCVRDAKGTMRPSTHAVHGIAGASCFAAGTPVMTPRGEVAIERLRPGEAVIGYDVESSARRVLQVRRLAERKERPVATFRLSNGEELRVTAEHPIFVVGRGYVHARALEIGDVFLGADGAPVTLDARTEFDHRTTVYDLSVDGLHNYFAGGVLVHNY
ncbi:Hint domain-containing protein [Polyangium mundeleinium]|uniref:Hint domain-containing protein n=1 Tax=Polyangium mundeleinium TaxID=2995306 RepID=A0ABT5EGG2_9BACT|nr:Hint domain-containing protein [Polyangium mundeleinium]MDC0740574.1 Hint domain-containing protein [Polyangium mundeleinium]